MLFIFHGSHIELMRSGELELEDFLSLFLSFGLDLVGPIVNKFHARNVGPPHEFTPMSAGLSLLIFICCWMSTLPFAPKEHCGFRLIASGST